MMQKIRNIEVWVNRQKGGRKELLPSGSRQTEKGVVPALVMRRQGRK